MELVDLARTISPEAEASVRVAIPDLLPDEDFAELCRRIVRPAMVSAAWIQ